jgi:AraC-like DNA-binding protein
VIAYLEKLDQNDVTARVRGVIIEGLSVGRVSKAVVARRLNMSPRTLQHRLTLHDTSFHDLAEETRQTLARAYLEDRSLTLTEIAYLLGFSNESNFSRAYKRWTGQPPGAVRRAGERARN